MAKSKTIYSCQECGAQRPKWEGRCTDCGSWNSFIEETLTPEPKNKRGWALGDTSKASAAKVFKLSDKVEDRHFARKHTGLTELNRVLGGGLVIGSYILVGGDPGIGKSTLLMQMAGGLAQENLKVLYVSAEESVDQTALRAKRLGVCSAQVEVASESHLESILQLATDLKPDVLIVDSIQTVYLGDLTSAPGSVSQVRECASRLMALAKNNGLSVFIIGHVTKDGSLAGPRVLEHMVDTVLSFEGDSAHQFRLLRALKNRFGATNELGVFQMDSQGLKEVLNPSEFFLEERGQQLIGSAVYCAMEGSRPLLCEIQALTTYSPMAMPRRTSIGFEVNRVHMLAAVLDKYMSLDLSHSDVFINIVGGLKISEPSADLAVAAALISSAGHQELKADSCFFGEIGLTGEVRAVSFAEDRIKEAKKLGYKSIYLPFSNKKHLSQVIRDSNLCFEWIRSLNDLEQKIGSSKKARRPNRPDKKDLSAPNTPRSL